jgi:polar amino acid transport system substrate-binding protein
VKRTTLLSLVSIVLLVLLLGACKPKAAAITVATDATFPPFENMDETTKKPAGFDIDLMNAIAEKNGWTINWVNTPFDSVLTGLASCQYDIGIAAISISEERKANMDFSNPYYNSGQIIVVRAEETAIKGLSDLDGKRVAAQAGTTGEMEAQKIPNVVYKAFPSYALAFQDLMNGQEDAVIGDVPVAMGYVNQNPDKLKSVGDVFTGESYGIAVCKQKSEYVEKINSALQAIIDDGTMNTLVMRWLTGSGQ